MKNKIKIVRFIILLVLVLTFVISLLSVVHRFYVQYEEDQFFEELSANTSITKANSEDSQKTFPASEESVTSADDGVLPEYESLFLENNDLYGWVKIDDTVIDYPVMYSPEEPQLYLYKNFYKEDSRSGTPFILTPSDTNTIVYGHNMKNKSMFSSLLNYKDTEFWNNHRYIQFNTLKEKGLYEVFMVSNAVVYYDETQIPENAYLFYQHADLSDEDDFTRYVNELKRSEYFDSGISAKYGDTLLTLVTCDYVQKDARIVIVAKKIG